MTKKISRKILTVGVVILIGVGLTYAFWPRPMMVEIGEVKRRSMKLTIDEEGRTRVHDAYVISTPVAGRLLRVDVEPGDLVSGAESVVAKMRPSNPTPLDVRSKSQALANLSAAEAALELAQAERERAVVDKELADLELERIRNLRVSNVASQAALDRAVHEARATSAALNNAKAAIAVRKAELTNARAQLISFENNPAADAEPAALIPIYAPATGRVLRIMQESEATLPAGAPVMEVGNVDNNLEVVVELLSSDAVQVSPGDKVVFTDWGGPDVLQGVVERIDPWGFTKVSALGVEEQRVNTIIRFTDRSEALGKLGHGFRVEVQIVIWEDTDALVVPASALFREGQEWTVFAVADDTASLRRVEIGRNNGVEAQVTGGLETGDRVVLYPSSELSAGTKVSQREVR